MYKCVHARYLVSQDQLEVLRKENAILKEEGAVGGATISPISAPTHNRFIVAQSQELSRDMLLAAASAESNLR